MSFIGFLALLPVYTYFLLFELERIHELVRQHVPKRERERVTRIGRRVGEVIASFFRGRLLICLLKGLVLAFGLTILQVPYGFLLGVLSGFLSLVPFVGPMIGFGATFLISLQGADPESAGIWMSLALIGGVFMLAEILEGYVFIPKILGDSLGLHPVVILLSVFVGGAAWQFKGWPFPGAEAGDTVRLFSQAAGFHVSLADEAAPPAVKEWNVTRLTLHRTERHRDRSTVERVWRAIDDFLGPRGSRLAY